MGQVYVSVDADSAGRTVGRMSLNNDVEGLRIAGRSLDEGNKLWAKWAENSGGSLIECGGDEARLLVPAHKLSEIPQLRQQYKDLTGFTVSVGVGMKISEADQALMAAKVTGKDKVVFFSEEVTKIIESIQDKTEAEKISEEYLNKADTPDDTDPEHANPVHGHTQVRANATHNGRTVFATPTAPASASGDPDSLRSAVANVKELASPGAEPASVEEAAPDFESLLHASAQAQMAVDNAPGHDKNSQIDQLKSKVADILQAVKEQIPILEELKEAAPDTYDAVMDLSQAVVLLAQELRTVDIQKSEELSKMATVFPLPKPKVRTRISIPIGTTLGDRIKIQHADGKTSWVQVRAGMVRSKDPSGHPVSALHPEGK